MDWLQGKRVAIAGKFVSMTQAEATGMIEHHGGHIVASVNRMTSILVVGQDAWPLDRDGRLPRPILKAQELQKTGHPISILAEDELIGRLRLNETDDGVRRYYTLSQIVDLLNVPRPRVRAWLHAGLIQVSKKEFGVSYFDFRQVVSAKTLFELSNAGISTKRIRRSLEQLKASVSGVDQPLEQLAFLEKNGRLLVRLEEGLIEPSGQMLLDFEAEHRTLPVQPTSAEQWFQLGCQQEEEGTLAEAADAYRQALLTGGPDADVIFNLANVQYALGQKVEASERFRQAVELSPDYAEAWNNLGNVLVELQRFDDAMAAYQRAIALHYVDAHYSLADLLDGMGRASAAREHWRACSRLDPQSARGRYARRKLSYSS